MVNEFFASLASWLQLHPYYAIMFAGVVAFVESFAIVGSVIPGSVTLTAIGVLIGTGAIPAIPTLLSAIVGAILGDLVSYYIGRHFNQRIRVMWPLNKHPALLNQGENFFYRHGGKSIFLGRFIGPIRSVLPLVAGMLKMPQSRFLAADIISAFLWAPAYMAPGILIGAAASELKPDTATRFIVMVLGALLLLSLMSWLMKWLSEWIVMKIDRVLVRIWEKLSECHRCRWFCWLLHNPKEPNGHTQLRLFLLSILSCVGFILVLLSAKSHGWVTHANLEVFHSLQSIRTKLFDSILVAVTFFGEAKVVLPMAGAVTIYLLLNRHLRTAYYWFLNAFCISAGIWFFKRWVDSPRPAGFATIRETASFPSGHTALAFGVLTFFALLIAHHSNPRWRKVIGIATAITVSAITFSRLYLGAHWLSDVLGGALLGSASVSVFYLIFKRTEPEKIKPIRLAIVGLSSLLLVWGLMMAHSFNKERAGYQPLYPIVRIGFNDWWQQTKQVLPLFHVNRVGKESGVFNLQWSGTLDVINQKLLEQGWKLTPKRTIYTAINRIAASDKTQQMPVLEQLYQQRYPVAVYTKQLPGTSPLLVLRLWHSGFEFTDTSLPLWLGIVQYRHEPKRNAKRVGDPLQLLTKNLQGFVQRRVSYHAQNVVLLEQAI